MHYRLNKIILACLLIAGCQSAFAKTTSVGTWLELKAAWNAAADGDVIRITADIYSEEQLFMNASGKTLTVSLNGKKLTANGKFPAFTVIDGTLNIKGDEFYGGAITTLFDAPCVVQAGAADATGAPVLNIKDYVLLTAISSSDLQAPSLKVVESATATAGPVVTLDNCTFNETLKLTNDATSLTDAQKAVITINSGTFSGALNSPVVNDGFGTITINGGTFATTNQLGSCIWARRGDIVINGGTFSNEVVDCGTVFVGDEGISQKPVVTITGGTFANNSQGTMSQSSEGIYDVIDGVKWDPQVLDICNDMEPYKAFEISGGTFTTTNPFRDDKVTSLFCKEGYEAVLDYNKYEVVPITTAATIGTATYTSLQDALNAAKEGETVTLVRALSQTVVNNNAYHITLDVNGQNYYCSETTITNNGRLTIIDSTDGGTVASWKGNALEIGTASVTEVQGDYWYAADKYVFSTGKATGATLNIKDVRVVMTKGMLSSLDDTADTGSTIRNSDNTINIESFNTMMCDTAIVLQRNDHITITGGTTSYVGCLACAAAGDIKISGGSFSTETSPLRNIGSEGHISVTGGEFSLPLTNDLCALGYDPCMLSEGKYSVKKLSLTLYAGSKEPLTEMFITDFATAKETYPNAIAIVDYSAGAIRYAKTVDNVVLRYTSSLDPAANDAPTFYYYSCPKLVLTDYGDAENSEKGLFYSPVSFNAVSGSYARNCSDKYMTCCLPFPLKVGREIGSDAKIMTFSYYEPVKGEDNTVTTWACFTTKDSVTAATPVFILNGTETQGISATFNNTPISSQPLNTFNMKGTFAQNPDITANGNCYVLSDAADKLVLTTQALKPFRSCVDMTYDSTFGNGGTPAPSASKPSEMDIHVIDEATAVNEVAGAIPTGDEKAYTILGQRTTTSGKHRIFIINGKKVLK